MARPADQPGTPPWGRRLPDPSLRVGDAERNEAAEALSQHFSDGRLDQGELKERLDRAMSAKTGADLSGLMADLPPLPGRQGAAMPVPPRRRGAGTWLLVTVVALALLSAPWHAGPWGAGHHWMWFPPFPWLLFAGIAVLVWRRSRRRRWQSEPLP